MRLALASLIAITGLTPPAFAQTAPTAPSTTTPSAPPPATPTPPATPVPSMAMPGAPSTPQATPTTAPPAAATPGATTTPSTPGAAPATPPVAEAPPAPPTPPTDPAAIGLLSALDTICVPVVSSGDLAKLAKAAGFRKSGDNYVYKQKTYQLTVLALGSNPHQCHVDIVHPIDPEAPAKPIVIALHNWAAVTRGYSLYRNDKNVLGSQEFTTRSWENDENGQHQALVITTIRKADGTPSQRAADTSEMIYSVNPTPAAS
jgi:hypothetical protein